MAKKPLNPVLRVLSSYELVIATVLMLGLLTFLGTLAQKDEGLFLARQRYFESWFVIHYIKGSIPLPLPGAQLVLYVFMANLIVGGIVRMRWNVKRLGILITHFGIAFLLFAGFVKFKYADEGTLMLFKGQEAAHYEDDYKCELVLTQQLQDGTWQEFVIPDEQLKDLQQNKTRRFTKAGMPFSIVVAHYMPNAMPAPPSQGLPTAQGVAMRPVRIDKKNAINNWASCFVTVEEGPGGKRTDYALWSRHGEGAKAWRPARFAVFGQVYALDLRKRTYPLPFKIKLLDARRELYPGSGMPKSYESDVNVTQGPVDMDVNIHMNSPLRRAGFILFQSNWGQLGPNEASTYSGFSVARNPSDQWPLWACIMIAIGLVLHFGVILSKFISKETRRTA